MDFKSERRGAGSQCCRAECCRRHLVPEEPRVSALPGQVPKDAPHHGCQTAGKSERNEQRRKEGEARKGVVDGETPKWETAKGEEG